MTTEAEATDSQTTPSWRLRALKDPVSVLRRDPADSVPPWVWKSGELVSVTRTADELSIICATETIGAEPGAVGPYIAYLVDAVLDFALTGVMSSLLEPLTEARISILALSTHDTDWILVPAERADEAVKAWRRRGHTVL
ncbi:MAG TPA: ACT domain-containing protein [Nocardioidaceae bacterium]|nr:ACT domain-containing protein [Nocardioidaceae bacterium]